jgi:hypothetical protein
VVGCSEVVRTMIVIALEVVSIAAVIMALRIVSMHGTVGGVWRGKVR